MSPYEDHYLVQVQSTLAMLGAGGRISQWVPQTIWVMGKTVKLQSLDPNPDKHFALRSKPQESFLTYRNHLLMTWALHIRSDIRENMVSAHKQTKL